MKASVIIPTLNRFEITLNTVEYCLSQKFKNFEVIVIDQNGAWPEDQKDRLNAYRQDSRLRWVKVNPEGVVSARQHAVFLSEGDILIFIDDDVIISDQYFIEKHVKNYDDTSIDAVCGREVISKTGDASQLKFGVEGPIDLSDYPIQVQPLIFSRNSKTRQDVCTFCTCNSSVRKSSLLRIGGFDENFRGASYGDDYDFAIRLCQVNGKIIFDPAPELIHLQSPSGGLRLSSTSSKFSEADKALSGWIFLLRHGRRGWLRYLFVNWVLRRTIFLKRNLIRFWILPLSFIGIIKAYFQARDCVKKGPVSRLNNSE